MALMLILNAEEADDFRGETSPMHFLDPVPLANGTEWVLPIEVLHDEAHASVHLALAKLPTRHVDKSEFPPQQLDLFD